MQLHERLACARADARKSLADVATAVGVSEDTVRRWEHGMGDPGLLHLPALCRVLSVSASWLVFGREKSA